MFFGGHLEEMQNASDGKFAEAEEAEESFIIMQKM